MSEPKIKVSFCLAGDNDNLDEITKLMEINPTKQRKKEDCPIMQFALTTWNLSTEKEYCKAVYWQFDKVLEKLKGKEEIINEICKKYNFEASFTVVVEMLVGNGPELVLTRDIISFASSINAEIGFDLYIDYIDYIDYIED